MTEKRRKVERWENEDRRRKFVWGPEDVKVWRHYCHSCAHWLGEWRCRAYPQGIPDPIRRAEIFHNVELPGDNGIRYKPKKP